MSCPFYGKCAIPMLQRVVSQNGNQCALIMESFSPCRMEVHGGKTPDWDRCSLNTGKMRERAQEVTVWMERGDGRPLLAEYKYPD